MSAWVLLLVPVLAIAATPSRPGETLIFEDDFNTFDFTKWKHEITQSGGGNWEFEVYVNNRSNSFVRNSILHIRPRLTTEWLGPLDSGSLDLWGGELSDACTGPMMSGCHRDGSPTNYLPPITSARLRTAEAFAFKYGRVEARPPASGCSALLPTGVELGRGKWDSTAAYGNWPASGEIDIMESRGNRNYPASLGGGLDTFGSTLHWGPNGQYNGWSQTHAEYRLPQGADFGAAFHVFGLYWDQLGLYTYIDEPSQVVMAVNFTDASFWDKGNKMYDFVGKHLDNPWEGGPSGAPFDQKFFLILNLAVGGLGGYFSDEAPGKPWRNGSPTAVRDFWQAQKQWLPSWGPGLDAALQVDWVRVWALDGRTDPDTAGWFAQSRPK
ncbi:putative Beta-1,3-glucan-binding protein [Paratrimastix pyriformis]|uniref:Beta-1,3-glucan-binding protein n=1 Tax=Paratrimastix pyriformis TaxID=342808 RepID=A0ABQ8U8B1_9EUKA|nr:putative Beta-1,3-glucan-binding protein [Paratrimastix pyriformis]